MRQIKTPLFFIALAAVAGLLVLLQIRESQHEAAQRELLRYTAVQDSLLQVAEETYTIQALERDGLKVENDRLAKALEDKDARVRGLLRLAGRYEIRIAELESRPAAPDTLPGDTATARPATVPAREFAEWVVPEEFWLAGRFQTAPPYRLTLTDARVHIRPEVVVGQDERGIWTAAIHSHSPHLVFTEADIQVRSRPQPFLDMRPRVDLYALSGLSGWEVGLQVTLRVWRIRPQGVVTNRTAGVGGLYRLYGDAQ